MSRPFRIVCLFLTTGVAMSCVVWMHLVTRYEAAFADTATGQGMTKVIARFGSPDVRDSKANPFLRYATGPCAVPCTDRLWWENPVFKGIEAWSVEFSSDGKVVGKAHWVSP